MIARLGEWWFRLLLSERYVAERCPLCLCLFGRYVLSSGDGTCHNCMDALKETPELARQRLVRDLS